MAIPVTSVRIPAALRCWIKHTAQRLNAACPEANLSHTDIILASLAAMREDCTLRAREVPNKTAQRFKEYARDAETA